MAHRNIMLIVAALEDFDHKVVQVPDEHPAVTFCELWSAAGGVAYVQLDDDKQEYIDMWHELDGLEEINLPCEVHHCIHAVAV